MFELKNKKVTILGAARSGLAAAELVLKLGAIAKISDAKDQVHAPAGVIVETGGHTKGFIQDSDYLVLSPGIRMDSQAVQWAKEKGVEVFAEIELAYRLCPCPIVAVTGSNGKTTTSTLIAQILQRAGHQVKLCGNIGTPFSGYILGLKPTDIVVLETSSFQLESTVHFKPHVALWTNFSQNHLDRHKDINEYFDAKKKIFANQDENDFAVINFNQGELREISERLRSKVVYFNDPALSQDISNPNFQAAMVAVGVLGVPQEISRQVFVEFKGVEHRLELTRSFLGVDYVNDSKSTTSEAGRWALQCARKPLIMICGGSDKHIDYQDLRPLVAQKVKHMIAIGQIREQIRRSFADIVSFEMADSLDAAVSMARNKAQAGDCVILSPMTASFDMFDDYEHRGRVFKDLVHQLT